MPTVARTWVCESPRCSNPPQYGTDAFVRVRGIGFSTDDQLVALGDENNIHIIDLEAQREIQTIPAGGVSDFW